MHYKDILHYLIYSLYFIAITIITYGTVLQYIAFIKSEIRSKNREVAVNNVMLIKNFLGSYILFSLEILIGADIIESVLDPTLEHILSLAALVVIRTIISYFLNKEINSDKST
ncbi:MAG: DUF1622 domain-containing protein [Peptostreptococcaceae bacterium]